MRDEEFIRMQVKSSEIKSKESRDNAAIGLAISIGLVLLFVVLAFLAK